MKKLLFIALVLTNVFYAQNASEYFPQSSGFKWFFRETPFDSLNNPVDSLVTFRIDTFAADINYNGRLSHLLMSKYGIPANILQNPFIDSSFVHMENSNIWNYVKSIETGIILPFNYEGWYSVYRLGSSTSTTYTVFTKDTIVTIGSTSLTLRFEVTGRRLNDELITTPYGNLVCKKFLMRPSVKYIPPIPIPITLVTINDTVWIAPGYYMVKSVQPSANVDLSLFGFPAFTIPGYKTEAIAPPPVLAVNPSEFNISSEGDSVYISVSNEGEGQLNWNAEISEGSSWITFLSVSSGSGNDSLFIGAAKNDSSFIRIGLIKIEAEGAFNSPQFVAFSQEAGIVISADDEKSGLHEYSLMQNYPNPFNPYTNIEFTLKSSGNVKLVLYDVLGKELSIITDAFYASGRHTIGFYSGNLPSGVYIYRITAGEFSSSGKMIIMR